MGVLQHISDVGVQPQLAALPVVPPVDEDLAGGGLEEAAGQVDQSALARPRLPHDGHGGARRDVQVEVAEHILPPIGIAETHVPELDLPPQRLPVLPLGVECVSVHRLHFWGVHHLGFLVQQAGNPLDGRLEGDELGQVGRNGLDGLEHPHGVGGKGGQSGDLQHLLGDHHAAPQHHDGHRQGGAKQHQGDIDRAEPGRMDAGGVHLAGNGPELIGALLLGAQGLGGLSPRDALVKGPGDPGVELAHPPVPMQDAPLKVAGDQGDGGHDEQDHQGQPPVQRQHGPKAAQHIEQRPQQVGQVPGDHG